FRRVAEDRKGFEPLPCAADGGGIRVLLRDLRSNCGDVAGRVELLLVRQLPAIGDCLVQTVEGTGQFGELRVDEITVPYDSHALDVGDVDLTRSLRFLE